MLSKETMEMIEYLTEINPEMIIFSDLEEAIIGFSQIEGGEIVACYDTEKCIEILIKDGMEIDEAREYFEANILGARLGIYSPVFTTLLV